MALRARYDVEEDRILLAFVTPEEVVQFWMTRRRWLGILRAASGFSSDAVGSQTAAPKKSKMTEPSGPELPPVIPVAVRVKNTGRGMKLIFERQNMPSLFFNCALGEVPGLVAFLKKHAELAGWDPDAALARSARAAEIRQARIGQTFH